MAEGASEQVLGIIAGSGTLPRQLVEHCLKTGRPCTVAAAEGEAEAGAFEDIPHGWFRLGAVGGALAFFQAAGARELVLAGKINRPKLSALRPDKLGAKLLARLGLSLFRGQLTSDNTIFKTAVAFLEEQGFRVVGVDDVMGGLTAPEGTWGRTIADAHDLADIKLGARAMRAVGEFDIGQAIVVKNGLILGVEAAEGTDALIARCAALKGEGKGGVLVKMRKPRQERRVDLPTIGPQTVRAMQEAGFAGIAVEAGHSLVLERREVVKTADAAGLFLLGFKP